MYFHQENGFFKFEFAFIDFFGFACKHYRNLGGDPRLLIGDCTLPVINYSRHKKYLYSRDQSSHFLAKWKF